MPAGRIFFSTAAFEEAALDPDMAVRIPPGDVFAAPSGVKIVRNGGLTIKENSWKNGFGAFGASRVARARRASPSPARAPSSTAVALVGSR